MLFLLRRERAQQPELGDGRRDCNRIEERARPVAQACRPGEDRIPHRLRDRIGAGGQRLDDEERVAVGLAVELVGVDAVGLGKRDDGRL